MSYKLEKRGNKGIITIEFSLNAGGLSRSGKTLILDSSHGFVWDGDVGISYNIVRKRKQNGGGY